MNNKMQNDRPLSIGGLRRRKGLCRFFASVAAAMFLFVSTAPAFADPTSLLGGNAVLTGMARATLDANDANAAAFSSSAASAVLDWSKFNVGAGQSMSFNGASTTFFNLVDGAAGNSQIDGIINGNGNVWVINPAGIAFGAGSSVNVGGLFAAAAGNVANADAIRDGTATTPAFSSFAGSVEASQGSFTANQVALMGKNVTVGGDASFGRTPQLTVAASSGAVTVDEVAGGTISVDLQDFAVPDEDVVANLQSLDTIAMTVDVASQGDVYGIDVALGLDDTSTVNVKAAGYANLDGAINARVNVEGESVRVAAYDKLTVGDVSAKSKAVLQGDFGIETLGDVSAQKVRLNSGGGGVTVKSGSTVHTDHGGTGNVDDAADAGFVAVAASGDITVEKGATVAGHGRGAVVWLTNESSSREASIAIDGELLADAETAGSGPAGGGGNAILVNAGQDLSVGGSVVFRGDSSGPVGSVELTAKRGDVKVGAGAVVDADAILRVSTGGFDTQWNAEDSGNPTYVPVQGGDIVVDPGSTLASSYATSLYAKSVKIGGEVQSHGFVDVMADESVVVERGAHVKTDGTEGEVWLEAGTVTQDADGQFHVSGGNLSIGEDAVVASDGQYGSVYVSAVNGAVDVRGALIADNEGYVDVTTGFTTKSGVCDPAETPAFRNDGGDVNVHASGKIVGQNVSVLSRGGKVSVDGVIVGTGCGVMLSGDGVTSSGTIDVRQGTLEVYGNRGDINLYNKASGVVYAGDIILVAEGNVYADNPNNKIGKVTEAKAGPGKVLRINLGGGGDDFETVEIGNIVSDTAYLRSEKGTIKVVGDITAPDQVVLETEEGDIIVMENCTVTATGSGAVVKLNAGRNIVSDGNLVADGGVELSAKNDITVNNAEGITLNGAVSENGVVSVSTKNGDIVIAPDAKVAANGDGGSVILKAGTLASGEGSVLVGENATLQAQDTILAIAGYGKLKASGALEGGDVPALKSALKAANFLLANSGSSFVEIGDRATVIAGRLISLEGKVSVISSGTINAANAKLEVVAHEGDINLYTPTEDHAGAGRVIAGQADFVVNGTGDINVDNGENAIDALGRVKADAQSDIQINLGDGNGGEVVTIGQNEVDANFGFVGDEGTILIVGDITRPDMVYFQSVSGDVIVMEGATVKVVDEGYGAYLMVSAGRSARIDGMLDSEGTVSISSYGTDAGSGITVGKNGSVKAGEGYSTAAFTANNFVRIDGTVDSKSSVNVDAIGDVTVGGSVSADQWASFGYAWNQDNVESGYYPIGGKISVDGSIDAGVVELFAMGDVNVGEGAELSAGNEVDVQSAFGSVAFKGKSVEAPLVDVQANGDITLGNIKTTNSTRWYGDVDGDGVDDNVSLYACAIYGKMTVLADATVEATDANGGIYLLSGGGFEIGENAVVKADAGANGNLFVTSEGAGSTMKIDGCLQASRETLIMNNGGNVEIGKNGRVDGGQAATVFNVGTGDVMVDGKVASDDFAAVTARGGSARIGGEVKGAGAAMVEAGGDIVVDGRVVADGMAEGMAVLQTDGKGNVVLGRNAEVKGALGAVVKTENGDLIQRSAPIVDASNRGYAKSESLRPVIAAENVILDVNGNVAGDNGGSVTVDGTLAGIVSGNAKIAIGNGHDLVGGTKQDAARVVEGGGGFFSVDLSALGENSAMLIGGNLSLYTAGGIGSYTTFEAGGDASISAARFGDTSYLQAGGALTINNVGHPSHPQIAYFESVNGREPRINNLPNDVVIFVDGRLAGGNLQIINKFGATEAFPVSTPELKSEQGIFGNPVFLHGDLDVANPMAVGNVDYMLQEIPRLTLASDFPLEVDKSVNTAGLNPKDVYRFGQHAQVAEEKPQAEQEEKKDDKASAEKSAEPKVAMR